MPRPHARKREIEHIGNTVLKPGNNKDNYGHKHRKIFSNGIVNRFIAVNTEVHQRTAEAGQDKYAEKVV
jgi:hypothetical protein